MWASSVGEDSATAEALVEILRPIPLTQDIVDRINNDCEWIFMVLQELTFLHRHPRERAGFRKEAKRGQSGFHKNVQIKMTHHGIYRKQQRTCRLRRSRQNSLVIFWIIFCLKNKLLIHRERDTLRSFLERKVFVDCYGCCQKVSAVL